MANLTYAQLEGQWIAAGGSAALAPIAAAIAEAESGGNPGALNANDSNGKGGTQSSFGLWQISNGTHTPPSPNWNNPLVNAQLAVAKYNAAKGWSPWGTYTSGAYKAFLSGSTTPDMSSLSGDASLLASTSAAGAGAAGTGSDANCAWSIGFGGIPATSWLNTIFGGSGNIASGSVCLVSKPQVRGLVGVFLIIGGLGTVLSGVSILAAVAALPAAERIVGGIIGGKAVGLFGKAAGASVPSAPAAEAPPPRYEGNSPSGTTPPPNVTVINRQPARRQTSPVASSPPARRGGRTQQGRQKAS